jgi:hypothetical protein
VGNKSIVRFLFQDPGHPKYLLHKSGQIFAEVDDGSKAFVADSSFFIRRGLAKNIGFSSANSKAKTGYMSFESVNKPGEYLTDFIVRSGKSKTHTLRLASIPQNDSTKHKTILRDFLESSSWKLMGCKI